jgi:Skp family chaperone for outer membrane proteins
MVLRIGRVGLAAAVVLAAAALPILAQGGPAPTLRFAVVDMDRVLSESQMGQAEQAGLDRLQAQKKAEINSKQKELEESEEQIRNASLTWSAEKRQEHIQRYEQMKIELRRMNEDATRAVQAEWQRSMAKLQSAALQVTAALGRERGYTMMFEKNSMPVLYASDTIEVTDDVIRRMNSGSGASAEGASPPDGDR